ncbi:hypothetical protein RRG08_055103, partial [Elysia crispata]
CIGAKTYQLLRSLTSPDLPSTKSYDELKVVLNKHLSLQPLEIAERFRFHKRNQREGESIQDYTVKIKRLSEHCKFVLHLDQSLRDKLVCDLRDTAIQKRLLQEADPTFQIAYDKAVALEMASRDATELHGNASSAQLGQEVKSIHAMARKPQPKGKFSACQSCRKTNHSRENSYFREAECKACHKKGHIQSVCRSKATQPKVLFKAKPKKVHQLEEGTDFFSIDLQMHQSAVTTNKIWVHPLIDNVLIRMELDTGSGLSLITIRDFKAISGNRHL